MKRGMLLSLLLLLVLALPSLVIAQTESAPDTQFGSQRLLSTLRFGEALPASSVPPADALPAQEQPHKVPPVML
jgi:hypothetical protein